MGPTSLLAAEVSERSRRSDRVVGGRRPFTRMRGAGAERGLVAPPGRYWPGERERTADGPALGASDLGVARTPQPLQDDLSLGRRAGGVRGGGRRLARAHGARSPRGSPPGRGRRGGDHSSRPPRRADDGPGPDPYPSCPLRPGAGSGPRRTEVTEGDSSPPWRRGGGPVEWDGRSPRPMATNRSGRPRRPGPDPGPGPSRAERRIEAERRARTRDRRDPSSAYGGAFDAAFAFATRRSGRRPARSEVSSPSAQGRRHLRRSAGDGSAGPNRSAAGPSRPGGRRRSPP